MNIFKNKRDINLINLWLAARAAESRRNVADNYGTTPSVPANIMLKLAERIWEKRRGR